MKKILIILACLMCLCACRQVQIDNDPNACEFGSETCNSDSDTYDTIINGGTFEHITMADAIDLFTDKGSGIIYFGFSLCPWCNEALPIMDEVAKAYQKTIYYVMTRDEDRELVYTPEEKAAILEYIGPYEDTDEEGNLGIYVPLLIVVQDGEVTKAHLGTLQTHDAHERKMTEEEKAQLKAIYEDMLK